MTGYVAFPKQYESVGNYMYLELNSNVFGQREGFFALVSVITKNKGQKLLYLRGFGNIHFEQAISINQQN